MRKDADSMALVFNCPVHEEAREKRIRGRRRGHAPHRCVGAYSREAKGGTHRIVVSGRGVARGNENVQEERKEDTEERRAGVEKKEER